jgi:hypothetical protein
MLAYCFKYFCPWLADTIVPGCVVRQNNMEEGHGAGAHLLSARSRAPSDPLLLTRLYPITACAAMTTSVA